MTIDGLGSSLFGTPTTELGTTPVELRDVVEVLSELQLTKIAVLKVNIEGGEYELLDRLHAAGWLARIDTLFIQFHEFAPGAYRGYRRSRRWLSQHHEPTWRYPWVWERWDHR